MPITMIGDRPIEVNDEGFLTKPDQWDEQLGETLAGLIDMELTDEHKQVLSFLRHDFSERKETATLRRVANVGGFDMKELFRLFPGKPAKKMSWLAGLPKPKGCV
ncbi:MAG TPA: TusE/DsrC/DsvC family sulfur relay protein [Tessaracoccus flavescens]|uniref:TusE/DsrC/DsvC family sulfur relay protein n=1 Tax=Tessaracoccus flavescens TaxID=399497 RepID=A0A921ELU9_9ACTN|nr:TusE/DsrC/DsvC family sulfur relay protein [Tessaracoccus flavescens]